MKFAAHYVIKMILVVPHKLKYVIIEENCFIDRTTEENKISRAGIFTMLVIIIVFYKTKYLLYHFF